RVRQQSPADAEHHRAVAAQQRLERRVVGVAGEAVEQVGVRVVVEPAGLGSVAQPLDGDGGLAWGKSGHGASVPVCDVIVPADRPARPRFYAPRSRALPGNEGKSETRSTKSEPNNPLPLFEFRTSGFGFTPCELASDPLSLLRIRARDHSTRGPA